MIDFGTVRPGTTLRIPFATYDSNDPSASVTNTGLATTDIEVYKDGSVTQRASDSGYALLDTDGIDFDGITGIHGFSIDLADNTTAGFWAAGSQYWVVVSSITVDAATINFIAATFRIGYEDALINTTIATLASQTSFTLTSGPAEDDALNGCVVIIHDVASAVQLGYAVISDYTGSTKTVTLAAGTTFTAAATDNIAVFPPISLSHIAGAAVSTSTAQLGVNVVNAGGTAWGSGAITAASIASDAITAAKIATGAIDADAIADGAIDAGAFAADAITAAKLAADVTTELQSGLATAAELAKVPKSDGTATWNATALASIQSEANDALVAYDPPTRAEATADKDEIIAYLAGLVIAKGTIGSTGNSTTALHLTGLTYGNDEINNYLLAIKDVSAGEWHARYIEDWADTGDLATVATLPFTPENAVDTYVILAFRQDVTGGAGLDAAGVRAAVGLASANLDTQLAAIDDAIDSEVAAILADTNELQTDWVNGGRLDLLIDAIKAKTDNLPASPAATGDIPTAAAIADAVLDEDMTAHQTQGTLGQAIGDPGADSDSIWALANTNLNATVGSRASQTSVDTIDDFLDTEIAAIKAKTDSLTFTTAGQVDAQVLSVANNALTAAAAAADLGTEIATAVWASASRTLTALGFTLGASDLAADTIGASELATDAITEIVNAVWTTQLTEAYNSDGSAPTGAQALFVIMQRLVDFAISSTTITVKKVDGTTTAYTLTLDDATSPTSSSRAT